MRRFLGGLSVLIVTLALLLPVSALAMNERGGGSGNWGGSSADDEIVQDYRIARNLALGLATVGFLASIGWWVVSADHPESRYRASWGIAVFSLAFLATVLDKTIVQGVAVWFNQAPGDLPLFWR